MPLPLGNVCNGGDIVQRHSVEDVSHLLLRGLFLCVPAKNCEVFWRQDAEFWSPRIKETRRLLVNGAFLQDRVLIGTVQVHPGEERGRCAAAAGSRYWSLLTHDSIPCYAFCWIKCIPMVNAIPCVIRVSDEPKMQWRKEIHFLPIASWKDNVSKIQSDGRIWIVKTCTSGPI